MNENILKQNWSEKTLDEVAEFINGKAFKPNDWSEKGYPIIRIQNLTDKNKPFNYFKGTFDKRYLVQNGDILVSWSATIGVFVWERGDAVLNQHIFKVILKENIDKKYFVYALSRKVEEMKHFSHGSTMKHITRPKFLRTEISIPPLYVQKKIVKILDMTSEIKKKKEQINKLQHRLSSSIFMKMFGDVIKNDKKWTLKTLAEVTDRITDGKHGDCREQPNSGYYFISAKDITNGKIDYSNARQIQYDDFLEVHKRTNLEVGDVLITNSGTIGRIAIATDVAKTGKTTFQKSVAIIKNKKSVINSIFLRYCMEMAKNNLIRRSAGSSQKNLLLKDLKSFQVVVPPYHMQEQFSKFASMNEIMMEKQLQNNSEIDKLFQSVLQRVFQGKFSA